MYLWEVSLLSDSVIRFSLRGVAAQPSLVLAVGEHLNPTLAQHLEGDFRLLRQVSLLDDLVNALKEEQPDTALVSRYLPGSGDLRSTLPAIRRAAPNCRIVLLLGDLDDDGRAVIQSGAQYGIFNVMTGQDLDLDSMRAALTENRTWNDIADLMPEGFAIAPRAHVQPVQPTITELPPEAAPKVVTKYAKIIAVVSGRGNVGTTTVAANLLAAGREGGVIGVDLDFTKPDLLLQFVPEDSQRSDLRELLNTLNIAPPKPGEPPVALDRRDMQILQEWVDKLPEVTKGVVVIPGPSRNIGAADVPRTVVKEILHYASQKARLVVVDTAFEIADEATLDLLYAADSILLVTTPDHSTVYQNAWMLQQLEDLRIPKGKIGLVVTHAGQKGLKGPREIAQMLGLPLAFALPYDALHHEAARVTRKPIGLRERPNGPFRAFVQNLMDDEEPAAEKPRRGILFGRTPRTNKGGQR